MPDGTTIQGVPDGVTQSQLMDRYGKFQAAQPVAQSKGDDLSGGQDNSFFGRIGQDYQNRVAQGQQAANAYVSGDQGKIMTGLDFAGKIGAGTGADAISEAAKSAYSYAPQGLKDAVSTGISALENSPPGLLATDAAHYLGNQYQDLAQRYPNAARHVEAATDIGSLLAPEVPFKGTSLAGAAVDAASSGSKALVEAIPQSMQLAADDAGRAMATTSAREQQTAALRKSASDLYQDSSSQDIKFGDQDAQNLNSALSALQPKTDLEQRSWASSGAARQAQDIQASLATEAPTLNGLLAKRNELNSEIKVATRSGNDAEAYKLGRVKDAMDETMMNGETETWQLANHQWAQQAILGDTDEIVNKALTRVQPANSLDTALNNYLGSYKSNGLSDEEWQALKNVTNNSSFDKLRKGAASGLLKFSTGAVGAHAGPVGAAAGYLMGHYGSEFLKDSAMAAKVEKLDKFRELIMSREPPVTADEAKAPTDISSQLKANRK